MSDRKVDSVVAADWPVHPDKDWQLVVEKAYDHGWQKPHWTSSHPTLILDCPEKHPGCRIRAFKTGNATSGPARTALRQVPRCPHRKIEAPLAKVDEALDSAERLIAGAEKLIARNAASEKVEELLELVSSAVDEAQRQLEVQFDNTSDDLAALDAEVEELLEESADMSVVGDVIASSGPPLREAKVTLAPLPPRAPAVVERQERLDALTLRRDSLGA